MTNEEAAIKLIELYGKYNRICMDAVSDPKDYIEAIAMGAAALIYNGQQLCTDQEVNDECQPKQE